MINETTNSKNKDNSTNNSANFEKEFHDDLYQYLLSRGMVDERLPEAPDLEQLWPKLGQSYIGDGIREYNTGYPSVALGWIMFVGMAVAKYWDVEWNIYSKVEDLYVYLRANVTKSTMPLQSARRVHTAR